MLRLHNSTLALLFLSYCALALPTDSAERMHIVADSTLFNYKTGLNIYEGHVKIDQGETHLTADRVTTQNDSRHKMEEAIAYGDAEKPAHYSTIPKAGDPPFHADAKIIRFYPPKSIVILEGDVSVKQNNNSFHGPLIVYNIKDQTVSTPATKQGQATIVIEPKQTS